MADVERTPLNASLGVPALALALVASLAITGCQRQRTDPVASSGAPEPAPMTASARAAGPGQQVVPGPRVVSDPASPRSDFGGAVRIGFFGEIDDRAGTTRVDGASSIAQVSFAVEGADFDPEVDRDGRFVVYASTQHRPTADIYRKSIQGTTITQLTTDPADDVMPSISPDASKVAFASSRSGDWDIYVMSIDGGAPTKVTDDPDPELHPTWSPDGKLLAYCKRSSQSDAWEIWVTEVNNPSVRHFLTYGLFPQWSPDPAMPRLLFQKPRERGSRLHGIWTIDYLAGEARHPTEIVSAANAATMHPCWSPDGRQVAFAVVLDPDTAEGAWPERSEIWVVDIDGGNRTPVVEGRFRNMQPTWGSDRRIYFVSNRSGAENLWSVAPSPASWGGTVNDLAGASELKDNQP